MDRQIVIARYNEDISWAAGLPAIVYNKGAALATDLPQEPLPNVGRESHTYLHHILSKWDDLAEMTLFTQAGFADHLPAFMKLEQLFDPQVDMVIPHLFRMREWDADGRLIYPRQWKALYDTGKIKHAPLTLAQWFAARLNIDLLAQSAILYTPGAMFSVGKSCIHQRPRQFYEQLLADVAHDTNPEEGHYLERAWCYIFATPGAKLRYLALPKTNPPAAPPPSAPTAQ